MLSVNKKNCGVLRMKAIIYTKVGSPDVLIIQDTKKPVPKANQVLVKVKTSAITNLEYMRFGGKALPHIFNIATGATGKPLGLEIAGVVEEVGKSVTSFKKGDEVFGLSAGMLGGWAEYSVAKEKELSLKPSNLSFEQAGAIPVGGITALGAIQAAKIQQGQEVLIYGASGSVGQYAVQLAKAYGATVTGVCSTRNLEMARSIGTDFVIDYKKEDFTQKGKTYDKIIGVNGYNSLGTYKKLLKKGGSYVVVGGIKQAMLGVLGGYFYFLFSSKKFGAAAYPMQPKKQSLSTLKRYAEDNKINPFIDKVYSIHEVADAIKYIVNEHAQGKVVISLDFDQ